MAVMDYEMPKSWNDKGMDWSNPDPRNPDYIMAIREALFERVYATQYYISGRFDRLSPWTPMRVRDVQTFIEQIEYMAHNFLNTEWDYESHPEDFPKMWTYRDLVECEGCEMYKTAYPGMLLENGGQWLRKIRNALDKLTVVEAKEIKGRVISRSGSEHDPPFGESIGKAMERAFADGQPVTGTFTRWSVAAYVNAWSGNVHWKTYQPDLGDSEYNTDGYCGYAQASMAEVTGVRNCLLGRKFDILTYTYARKPTKHMTNSDEISTAIFDPGSAGFREGINFQRVHVDDISEMCVRIGSIDMIPQNGVVPVSDFDGEGQATWRRGAKRGYESQSWVYLDYACEDGFRFRPDDHESDDGG